MKKLILLIAIALVLSACNSTSSHAVNSGLKMLFYGG
ncbi:TPA: lipoprotein, partial [Staphylococcus aureus]|nr:lipoprotein [Staphylococcus aureus]